MCTDGWQVVRSGRRMVAFVLVAGLLAVSLPGAADDNAPDVPGPATVTTDPLPIYRHVTNETGLGDFLHAGYVGPGNGSGPDPLFTEFTGPGACWLDHDSDGWLDLYLVNTRHQTFAERNAAQDPHSMLYRNQGDGTFVDVTATANARTEGILQGCAAADYDNDGDTDLYVTGWNGSFLLRNDGGVFSDITDAAGVRDDNCGDFRCWASSASWFDADLDGCLDLFVAHFTEFDPADPPPFNGPGPGQRNRYYHSDCDGTFTARTLSAGLWGEQSDSWSAVASDLDNDGWPDLYVSNDGDANDLYINDGDGTFTRRWFSATADNRSGMGTAIADFDHSGRVDIVTTNYLRQNNGIFQAFGAGYLDIGENEPFNDAFGYSGWATHWLDLDNDGHLDLMVFNGMTEDHGIQEAHQPILAYRNLDGAGAFESVRLRIGDDVKREFVARGGGWADYDNDGDVDFLLAEAGESPTHLYRADGVGNRFLTVDVGSTAPGVNPDGIGARVTVSGALVDDQMQEKVAGTAFLSGSDPRLHFGLGDAGVVDVTVDWPGGGTDTFLDVRANSFVRVVQGIGLEVVDELPLIDLDGPTGAVKRLNTATFTATAEPAAGRSIVSYEWDFGDGVVRSGEATTSHAFTDVGMFTVRVTAVDSAGARRTEWMQVDVWDFLEAHVEMTSSFYGPFEQPSGVVRVTFRDGTPVRDAQVSMNIARSTGDETLDERVEQLPFFMHQFTGLVPIELSGTTDADGLLPFVVPHNVVQVSPLVPLQATHPGEYLLTANGHARGSLCDPTQVVYRVVTPDA